jgi:outer membrane protein TolC
VTAALSNGARAKPALLSDGIASDASDRRPDYLSAWWNVVNWEAVGARFEAVR